MREGMTAETQPGPDRPGDIPILVADGDTSGRRAAEPRATERPEGPDNRAGDGVLRGHGHPNGRAILPGGGELPLAGARPGATGPQPGDGPAPERARAAPGGVPLPHDTGGASLAASATTPAGTAAPAQPASAAAGTAEARPALRPGSGMTGEQPADSRPRPRIGALETASQSPPVAAGAEGRTRPAPGAARDPDAAIGGRAPADAANAASRNSPAADARQALGGREQETAASAISTGSGISRGGPLSGGGPAAASLFSQAGSPDHARLNASPDGRGADVAAPSVTPPPAETPRPVAATGLPAPGEGSRPPAHQLADAARPLPDGPVEVRLEPEELGRVRMLLSATDGTMNVSLAAEREETAVLLRRHLDELAQEFRELGYSDVRFSFEQEAGGDRPGGEAAAETASAAAPPPVDPGDTADPAAPVRVLPASGRIDMRL